MDEHLIQAAGRLCGSASEDVIGDADTAELRAALEETHAHLTRKIVALSAADARIAALEAALARAEHDLAHARGTIHNMERSFFWRIRGIWTALGRALGRPA